MKSKKEVLGRLLTIYILFLVMVVLSVLSRVIPDLTRGFNDGMVLSGEIQESMTEGESVQHYILYDIPIKYSATQLVGGESDSAEQQSPRIDCYVSKVDLTVEEPVEGDLSALKYAFGTVGGSVWYYVVAWLMIIAYISIILLLALIINSLRRSIRNSCEVSILNVLYTRIVAALIIVTELVDASMVYSMKLKAAELLNNSGVVVDTSFSPDFWVVILGVVVLFMAEVFAISHYISEEQKLTI